MMLVSVAAETEDLLGKMFTFPEDSSSAHVKLLMSYRNFSALTVCHRSFTDLTRSHAFFSLFTSSAEDFFLVHYHGKTQQMMVHIGNTSVGYSGLDYAPNKWHSLCTTWDSSSGLVQLWFNGQRLSKKYIFETIIRSSIFILGQGEARDGRESFTGMMSDFQVWDYALSLCEIQRYNSNPSDTSGNVIDWRELDFEIIGRVLVEFTNAC
ncbi:serum amyloid P-component-like [Boleophthalmus pectinirostris]|uniref:serum amyloid P-component-like n=1 Tax=Boleophthalmus pectinirostris TaxID=150288 RepID=UPI000A1C1BA0|nr:serum amyloid P-component-like [Boleophthalmus pectinirostris]